MTDKNITFDDILKSIKETEDNIDYDHYYVQQEFHNRYTELDGYSLIDPYKVTSQLRRGNIIRYSKGLDKKLSCASIVMKITYFMNVETGREDRTLIDNITLLSIAKKNTKKYWIISPSQCYIFKYMNPKTKQSAEAKRREHNVMILKELKRKLEAKLKEKNVKHITVSKDTEENLMALVDSRVKVKPKKTRKQ